MYKEGCLYYYDPSESHGFRADLDLFSEICSVRTISQTFSFISFYTLANDM